MDVRPALPVDYAGISELALANHRSNLSSVELQNGFLSAKFTMEEIADMAHDLGIIVARSSDRIVGFVCASRREWYGQPPMAKRMWTVFAHTVFHGRPLNEQDVFIYGPVCIDVHYRGQGLLQALYGVLNRELCARYEAGMCFVAEENQRSLRAHTNGLGMTDVGHFIHNESRYHALAFHVAEPM